MPKTSKGDQTRVRILRSARELFAAEAYDRVSVRKIAATAGVDPALINHYFGGKEKLFQEVIADTVDSRIRLDAVKDMLTSTPKDQLGERIIRFAEHLWNSPDGQAYLAAMRHAIASNAEAAVSTVARTVLPLSEYAIGDDPQQEVRSMLLASQLSGLTMMRHIAKIEPMASIDTETLVTAVAPTLQRYINGDIN